MLYQINIITLMVPVHNFENVGGYQWEHFSVVLHVHSKKLIFKIIYLEMMIIMFAMVTYSLLLSGLQLATTVSK